jgi:hypothetical protein
LVLESKRKEKKTPKMVVEERLRRRGAREAGRGAQAVAAGADQAGELPNPLTLQVLRLYRIPYISINACNLVENRERAQSEREERERERETDRQTDRQTDKQTDRQTDIERERAREKQLESFHAILNYGQAVRACACMTFPVSLSHTKYV